MAVTWHPAESLRQASHINKFPGRRENLKPNVSEVLRSTGLPPHSSSTSQHCEGPQDTAEIIKTVPQDRNTKGNMCFKKKWIYPTWRSRIVTDTVAAVCHQTKVSLQ